MPLFNIFWTDHDARRSRPHALAALGGPPGPLHPLRHLHRGAGGWTVLACVLPIVGSVIYLVSRGPEAEDINLGIHSRRDTAAMYR